MTLSHRKPHTVKLPADAPNVRAVLLAVYADPRLSRLELRALCVLSALATRDSFTACTLEELQAHLRIPGYTRALRSGLLELHRLGYLVPAEAFVPELGRVVAGVRVTLNVTQFETLARGALVADVFSRSGRAKVRSDRATPRSENAKSRSVRANSRSVRAIVPSPRARVETLKGEKREKTGPGGPVDVAGDVEAPSIPPPPASPLGASGGPAGGSAGPVDLAAGLADLVGRMPGRIQTRYPTPEEREAAESILDRCPDGRKPDEYLGELAQLIEVAGRHPHWKKRLTLQGMAAALPTIAGELRTWEAENPRAVVATRDPAADAAKAAAAAERAEAREKLQALQDRAMQLATLEGHPNRIATGARAAKILAELQAAAAGAGGAS